MQHPAAAAAAAAELPTVAGGYDCIDWLDQPRSFDASTAIDQPEAQAFFQYVHKQSTPHFPPHG